MQEDKRRQDEKRERYRMNSVDAAAVGEADLEKNAVKRSEAEVSAGFGMRTGAAIAEEEAEESAMRRRAQAEKEREV
jgi:hypothetical protein